MAIHKSYKNFESILNTYMNIATGDLTDNQKKEIYYLLSSVNEGDLKTLEDHKSYIGLLHIFRKSQLASVELFGKNFRKTIESLLMVGEDGVYSNSKRFIYELIQNVDDCEFEDLESCKLDVQFCWNKDPGEIIFTYNEKGFKPENVFAITGIAEASKNISVGKVEIGEKGIGFKSVFGIADSVLIQSGKFSFEIKKDNFTVPIPRYDNFNYIEGTQLTIKLPAKECKDIFHSIIKEYNSKEGLVNKNPILFLNKLTNLKMYFDGFRYINFHVERKTPELVDNLLIERDVNISVVCKMSSSGISYNYNNSIVCNRYTMPVKYGRRECVSRYTEETMFLEKSHNIIAVFPREDFLKDISEGNLYSFLPTQIKLNVPMMLHVPFKLDGSREFVDSQKENQWFKFTVSKLSEFWVSAYNHLATVVKEEIINYILTRSEYFFKKENEKVKCLLTTELKEEILSKEKIFFVHDGTFESKNNIIAFDKELELNKHRKIYDLLSVNKKLFIPRERMNLKKYDIEIISNYKSEIFKQAMKNAKLTKDILDILDEENEFDYLEELNKCVEEIVFTAKHFNVITNNKKLWSAIQEYIKERIQNKKVPNFIIDNNIPRLDEDNENIIKELIEDTHLRKDIALYLSNVNNRIYVIPTEIHNLFFAAKNGVLVARENPLYSFGDFIEVFDKRSSFSSNLKLRQVSEILNNIDDNDNVSSEEYLEILAEVRSSVVKVLGKEQYKKYIKFINEAGSNEDRFINELLQNADDCIYDETIIPSMRLKTKNEQLFIAYNEIGFSKNNVRAITSIGESTKNLLMNGLENKIGEKGIGFKSVFSVASTVGIHSNGFHFNLTSEKPTVPKKSKDKISRKGTTIILKLKGNKEVKLEKDELLNLCLCLRKLKNININDIVIKIRDTERNRIVSVDSENYNFEKYKYIFEVEDNEALVERLKNNKGVSKEQTITCYIPLDEYNEEKLELQQYVYAGLPTEAKTKIPLIVDAPFELTTARDNIQNNRWNRMIRENVYNAIIEIMKSKKTELRIDVLQFIRNNKEQNNNFNNPFLNDYEFLERIKDIEILPTLQEEYFVASSKEECVRVPNVILKLAEKENISDYFEGIIIDTRGKVGYTHILNNLGCKMVDIDEIIECLAIFADYYIEDKEFRESLYNYLADHYAKEKEKNNYYDQYRYRCTDEKIRNMAIFPVKYADNKTKYIPYCEDIFTDDNEVSTEQIYILNTDIMGLEISNKILGIEYKINKFDSEIFNFKYIKVIKAKINGEKALQEKAIYLLAEFNKNRMLFEEYKTDFIGLLDKIPMKMSDGNFKDGNKFIIDNEKSFKGMLLKSITVSEEYKELAKLLKCKNICEINYSDIDVELYYISDGDIEDIQNYLENSSYIISEMIEEEYISEEQIEKYNLQSLNKTNHSQYVEEEFPGEYVEDYEKLIYRIDQQWRNNKNPYIRIMVPKRKPQHTIHKETYLKNIYKSKSYKECSFCQMCERVVSNRYIERNEIRQEPKYAWDQMHLNLCLECSKDFLVGRKNSFIWRDFVEAVRSIDVIRYDKFEVKFGIEKITFAATHLAEIQKIMEVEAEEYDDSATVRYEVVVD